MKYDLIFVQCTIKCLFIFLVLALFSSCRQKYAIAGHIKGLGDGHLSVIVTDILKDQMYLLPDSVPIKGGRFIYDHITDGPIILEMTPSEGLLVHSGKKIVPGSLTIFVSMLPNEKIKINGFRNRHFIDYTIKGSEISSQYNMLRKKKLHIMVQNAKNYLLKDSLEFYGAKKHKIEEVAKNIKQNWLLEKKTDSTYIADNLDRDLSAYLLWMGRKKWGYNYQKLSKEVREGVYKPVIEREILSYNRSQKLKKRRELGLIMAGKKAPDFTLKKIDGNMFNLFSAEHEFIVLDFWGSWCRPCIEGFPRMKEYYDKYKERIEFVGVACKDKEEKWKQSVKENGLQWTQLIDDRAKDKDISFQYTLSMYPTKIILDKEKKIIGVFEGESDEFYIKLDELMTSNK